MSRTVSRTTVWNVDVRRLRRDLAEDDDEAGRRRRLAGDAGVGVVPDDRVEDGVRDLVAQLVRVALGHRFGREQVLRRVDDAGHAAPRRDVAGRGYHGPSRPPGARPRRPSVTARTGPTGPPRRGPSWYSPPRPRAPMLWPMPARRPLAAARLVAALAATLLLGSLAAAPALAADPRTGGAPGPDVGPAGRRPRPDRRPVARRRGRHPVHELLVRPGRDPDDAEPRPRHERPDSTRRRPASTASCARRTSTATRRSATTSAAGPGS